MKLTYQYFTDNFKCKDNKKNMNSEPLEMLQYTYLFPRRDY